MPLISPVLKAMSSPSHDYRYNLLYLTADG